MSLSIVLCGTEHITATNTSSKEEMTFIAVSAKGKKVLTNVFIIFNYPYGDSWSNDKHEMGVS